MPVRISQCSDDFVSFRFGSVRVVLSVLFRPFLFKALKTGVTNSDMADIGQYPRVKHRVVLLSPMIQRRVCLELEVPGH